MDEQPGLLRKAAIWFAFALLVAIAAPEFAMAQSADPFETGANSLVTSLTTLATPIAVLLVMGLGVAAAAGRISWGWPLGIIVGICLLFSAQPMVAWLKGLFGTT